MFKLLLGVTSIIAVNLAAQTQPGDPAPAPPAAVQPALPPAQPAEPAKPDAQPAPQPAGSEPTPAAAPDLLAGPAVVQSPQRLTLVRRSFNGVLEDLEDETDAAAIALLDLTDEQRAKYDRIRSERTVVFDQAVRANYPKIIELAAMRGDPDQRAYLRKLGELAVGFTPYRARGTFFSEMEPFLTKEQVNTALALITEYAQAKTADMLERGSQQPSNEARARMRLESFGQMVRRSIERQVQPKREAFDRLVESLNLTPEQQGKAQAILQPLAVKQFQDQATKADTAQALADLRAILTPSQRQEFFALLVREFAPARPAESSADPAPQKTSPPEKSEPAPRDPKPPTPAPAPTEP